jgi:serine/threonine protein kinase
VAAENTPQPGQLVGAKYRILRTLGQGAMGSVLEAQHVATGKRVAIKWLHAHVMESRSAVERLVREAQASARVRHSNVVDVYDVEREGDALFLVMEYLEGETLTTWLERGGVPMHELLSIIVQAMRGVNEAHRRGIVHRDIKPDNIFLANEPDQPHPIAKVLDFGISKMDLPGGVSLTQTGSALGTPLYMSYEQLSGVRDVDARSDVYGFGVILYEALTGTLPYSADNFAELAAKVITSEPTTPRQLRPDIPEGLEHIVLWCMKKRREERAPNLSVVIDALLPYTLPHSFDLGVSSARLPAVAAVARLPVSSTPAPPPSRQELRLGGDDHDWNSLIDRSERDRRQMEERVTALVAGTMYEGRRTRKKGGGFWAVAFGAIAALAVGITLATVTRGGESPAAPAAPPPQAATEQPSKPAEPEQQLKAEPQAPVDAPKPAAPEPAAEPLEAAAPTQVEPAQMAPIPPVPPVAPATRPDAGAGAKAPPARATAKPAARAPAYVPPVYSPPSGELAPPPVYEPPSAPVEPPPPAAAQPEPVDPPIPRAPVDVNPFEGEPESDDTYRAGRPREEEF